MNNPEKGVIEIGIIKCGVFLPVSAMLINEIKYTEISLNLTSSIL